VFKIILISIILLSISIAGMAFNLIFRKNGKFPSYRVGHNKDMKKLGINCVKYEELRCHSKIKDGVCTTCSE
jgi:CRISPR/Cas system CMR-associated protein Cmr3 (group 5 of RAMP superfamily)